MRFRYPEIEVRFERRLTELIFDGHCYGDAHDLAKEEFARAEAEYERRRAEEKIVAESAAIVLVPAEA
ncbi:MAG: hypothetical protein WC730_02005 [Patescibacteria group bacterium]|jgi:hypothetical protein